VYCAADGGFSFRGVPGGKYHLIARITWAMCWAHHGGYVVRNIDFTGETRDIDIV
jgi:hypothetical protein